ncbi:MAG TPA: AraC family transcriptional regulator [Xanthobacteraceae bacterium]|nr:AraC family transcriptional regulator [Xanthobacteraceae bacterium]
MSSAVRIAYGKFGRVALLDMDRSLVRHAHPHCHVLIKLEGADTQFSVGDEIVALTDRQAVLVNAWEPHAYVHNPLQPRTTILALYIEPEWLSMFRSNWSRATAPSLFQRPGGELSPRIRELSMNLANIMVLEPCAVETQESLLAELMIAVIERFTPWRTIAHSATTLAAERARMDWRIRRAVDLLRETPNKPVVIEEIAKESGLSRAQFYRLFQRSTNLTPNVYLNMLRMELAVRSVVDSPDSLAKVSCLLGFSAPPHFSRFFKDHAGASPNEFRNVARMGGGLS